jgi:hypothetical protein
MYDQPALAYGGFRPARSLSCSAHRDRYPRRICCRNRSTSLADIPSFGVTDRSCSRCRERGDNRTRQRGYPVLMCDLRAELHLGPDIGTRGETTWLGLPIGGRTDDALRYLEQHQRWSEIFDGVVNPVRCEPFPENSLALIASSARLAQRLEDMGRERSYSLQSLSITDVQRGFRPARSLSCSAHRDRYPRRICCRNRSTSLADIPSFGVTDRSCSRCRRSSASMSMALKRPITVLLTIMD